MFAAVVWPFLWPGGGSYGWAAALTAGRRLLRLGSAFLNPAQHT